MMPRRLGATLLAVVAAVGLLAVPAGPSAPTEVRAARHVPASLATTGASASASSSRIDR